MRTDSEVALTTEDVAFVVTVADIVDGESFVVFSVCGTDVSVLVSVVMTVLCVLFVKGTTVVVDSEVGERLDAVVVADVLLVEVSLFSAALVKVVAAIRVVLIVRFSVEFDKGADVELTPMSLPVSVDVFCKFINPFSAVASVKASDRQQVSKINTVSMTSKTLVLR